MIQNIILSQVEYRAIYLEYFLILLLLTNQKTTLTPGQGGPAMWS